MRIPLRDESVHCIVTSPPYWGLRDYRLPPLIWGGDADCEHKWPADSIRDLRGTVGSASTLQSTGQQRPECNDGAQSINHGSVCVGCGAWRGSLGLELLHDCGAWSRGELPCSLCYLCHLRSIFAEVRRVLRCDGTLWVNVGDSYAASGRGGGGGRLNQNDVGIKITAENHRRKPVSDLKQLDMVGTPWRLALALQADGWHLRSDVIWHKNNPMPESVNGWRWERHRIKVRGNRRVTQPMKIALGDGRRNVPHVGDALRPSEADDQDWRDCPGCKRCESNGGFILRMGSWRPTKSHEYVLLFSKSASYFCDAEAVREASTEHSSGNRERIVARSGERGRVNTHLGSSIPYHPDGTGRNRRSVWTLSSKPYPDSHFATFPRELPFICIKAGTSERGCCAECGAPWVRVLEGRSRAAFDIANPDGLRGRQARDGFDKRRQRSIKPEYDESTYGGTGKRTIGWRPSCPCGATCEPVPAIVLDPFVGSGTTVEVAADLLRCGIGIDLSFDYLSQLATKRIGSRLHL